MADVTNNNRAELIKIFNSTNDILRSEGIRSGIEQFNEFIKILFIKLASDKYQKDIWDHVKTVDDDELIEYFNKITSIFNEILTYKPLLIKYASTLKHIISSLDKLDLSSVDSDVKGDAFEFFISSSTSDGGLGEYYTPREIVKTLVKIANPKLGEKVYDPFCGTGGILPSAFKNIAEHHKADPMEVMKTIKVDSIDGFIAGQNKELAEIMLEQRTIFAGEISDNASIAKMNLYLEGRAHCNIQQIDSLANPIDGLYDVVITNIPFSQKITSKITVDGKSKTVNTVSPLYYVGLAKNSGDGVCVLHCLKALRPGGRMAILVPEGFLFRNDLAKVREFILSKAKLDMVVSLPQGTFLPYTGVKTSLLYFTDAHMPNEQKDYKWCEVNNIGLTLDNHKRKIEGENDLDKLIKHFEELDV